MIEVEMGGVHVCVHTHDYNVCVCMCVMDEGLTSPQGFDWWL